MSVTAGDSIIGTVTGTGCLNGTCSWTVVTGDVNTGARSDISLDERSDFTYGVGRSMEVYELTSCPNFPAYGVKMEVIGLYDQSNHQVMPSWTAQYQSGLPLQCAFNLTLTSNSVNLFVDPGPEVRATGPETGQPYSLVTVTANVSAGVTPYSYGWTIMHGTGSCGNTPTCTARLANGGTGTNFFVTVTDADKVGQLSEWTVNACANGTPVVAASARPKPYAPQKC